MLGTQVKLARVIAAMQDKYESLSQNDANFVALSPLSIIRRTADIYANKIALIDGARQFTWADIYSRSKQLASALNSQGISTGDTVSILSPNNTALFECHFAIPMVGAVINAINTRLEAETIGYILNDSDAKVLIFDSSLAQVVTAAIEQCERIIQLIEVTRELSPRVIEGAQCYESFLDLGDSNYEWRLPKDEWQALALNYTSGTSGRPKGVVYHHRGSYLMALGTIAAWQLPSSSVYLYTVPMFHCNGWGHAWTMALTGGTVVCPQEISAKEIYRCIAENGVTHFGGAPVILSMLVNASTTEKRVSSQTVKVMTAGAPPPASVLEKMSLLGFDVMQVYGLTETFGHVTHCLWQEEWDDLDVQLQSEMQARQGVSMPVTEDAIVADGKTGIPVPRDGKTQGEILIRGNTVMKGYYGNTAATEEAFTGRWFNTGDVAVWWDKGYIQIKDRLKDVIISGGENISSVEIENIIHRHPGVELAAVVGMANEKWGEVPCAFVTLKEGAELHEQELIEFCRKSLAGFKTPKKIVFGEIPQTATGKIQKYALRKRVKQWFDN